MSKSKDRNSRAVVGEEESMHKFVDADKNRAPIGVARRMDVDRYLRMKEYEGKVLFWATSKNGDVERWIAAGAEPVPKVGKSGRTFKGINDREEDQYEIAHSVSVVEGVAEDNYLMFLPEEDYEELRVGPKKKRNAEIAEAMGIGKVDAESLTMPGVRGLHTYAPNVGDGKVGLSTIQAGELTHPV